MLTVTSTVFLTAILIGLIIGLIALLVLQLLTSARVNRLTSPIYEYALSKAQADADRILGVAQEKARAMLADAQTQATTLAEVEKGEIEKQAAAYKATLDALAERAQHSVEESVQTARREHADVVAGVTKTLHTSAEEFERNLSETHKNLDTVARGLETRAQEAREALIGRVTQAGEHLEQAFASAGAESRARVDKHLEALFARAEEEIGQYRTARKQFVDAHMAELVAEATKIALRKSLSSRDHAELVRQALEEAKSSGIL